MKKETFHLLLNFLIILKNDLLPLARRYRKAKSLVKNAPHRRSGKFLTRLFPFLCWVIKRIKRNYTNLFVPFYPYHTLHLAVIYISSVLHCAAFKIISAFSIDFSSFFWKYFKAKDTSLNKELYISL